MIRYLLMLSRAAIEIQDKNITQGQCVVFGEGDLAKIVSKKVSRFLFVSGEPLNEPVAWRGPIVMNTEEELDRAFKELESGTFIKPKKALDNKKKGQLELQFSLSSRLLYDSLDSRGFIKCDFFPLLSVSYKRGVWRSKNLRKLFRCSKPVPVSLQFTSKLGPRNVLAASLG